MYYRSHLHKHIHMHTYHIHIHEKRKNVSKTEGKYAHMSENVTVEAQLLTMITPLLWECQQSILQGKKGPCLAACFV